MAILGLLKHLMIAFLNKALLLAILALGSAGSKSSASLGYGGSEWKLVIIISSGFHFAQNLHPRIPQLCILFPHVLVFLRVVVIWFLHIQDDRSEDDEHSHCLPIWGQFVPQFSHDISRGRLIGIFDESRFLESGQKLQVGEFQSEQLRWDLPRDDAHDIGNIANELVIAELELFVLALMIILFEDIFLDPLWYVVRDKLLIDALDVIFAELILFIVIKWFFELKRTGSRPFLSRGHDGLCLMEVFD